VLHQHVPPRRRCRGRPLSSSSNATDELMSQLNHERENRLRLQGQLDDANRKLQYLTVEHDNLVLETQVTPIATSAAGSNTPFLAASKMASQFLQNSVPPPPDEVGHGVLETLMSHSRLHNAMNDVVISNVDVFSVVANYFQQKMYNENLFCLI
jgi:hypothetical protein